VHIYILVNTSYLRKKYIEDIQGKTFWPKKSIKLHFITPPYLLPVLLYFWKLYFSNRDVPYVKKLFENIFYKTNDFFLFFIFLRQLKMCVWAGGP